MKYKIMATFAVGLLVAGCQTHPPVVIGELTSSAVTIDDTSVDFIKVWHLQVSSDVQLNITSTLQPSLEKCDWTGCGHFALHFADELKQKDGKWVEFDCDNVAEKIIDRDLVPKVEDACRSVHATAIEYWKRNNDPNEFTAKDGRVWKRQ